MGPGLSIRGLQRHQRWPDRNTKARHQHRDQLKNLSHHSFPGLRHCSQATWCQLAFWKPGDGVDFLGTLFAWVFPLILRFFFFLPPLHVLLLSERKKINIVTLSYQTFTFQALSYNDQQSRFQFLNGKKNRKSQKHCRRTGNKLTEDIVRTRWISPCQWNFLEKITRASKSQE